MTIERGRPWGEPGGLPEGGVIVRDDTQARMVVEPRRRAGEALPVLGLAGGDLCRTVGGTGDEARLRGPSGQRLPVDLGSVLVDGRQHWFVAHLVARRGWWWGRLVAVMNAQFLGRWDVAPQSHPNDGRLDVVDADLRLGDRWKAWRRLPAGLHVPHPAIRVQRVSALQLEFDRPMDVYLDGM
ncbi:MAG TPA: hypothetical protein VF855_04595, partial [Acidimicrobiales bacterium]